MQQEQDQVQEKEGNVSDFDLEWRGGNAPHESYTSDIAAGVFAVISANIGLICAQIVFSGRDTVTLTALIVILRGANDAPKSPHVVGFVTGFHVFSSQI